MNGHILSPDEVFVFIISYYHRTILVKKKKLVRFVRSNMLMPILWMRKKASERKEKKKNPNNPNMLYVWEIHGPFIMPGTLKTFIIFILVTDLWKVIFITLLQFML